MDFSDADMFLSSDSSSLLKSDELHCGKTPITEAPFLIREYLTCSLILCHCQLKKSSQVKIDKKSQIN